MDWYNAAIPSTGLALTQWERKHMFVAFRVMSAHHALL